MKTVIANWKMNGSESLLRQVEKTVPRNGKVRVGLCPPYTLLGKKHRKDIWWGAQNVFYEKEGAYTGEISVSLLCECNINFVLVGHSERRMKFGETDEVIGKKLQAVIGAGLTAVFCLGETKDQREKGQTYSVLQSQMQVLNTISVKLWKYILIAYEPVWAIGTGVNATNQQVAQAHAWLHNWIATHRSKSLPILYGGSVNEKNAPELLKVKYVDGLLVGGASLKPKEFAHIVAYANDS